MLVRRCESYICENAEIRFTNPSFPESETNQLLALHVYQPVEVQTRVTKVDVLVFSHSCSFVIRENLLELVLHK